MRNCVSLGELTCLGKDGPAHPITAYAEGAVFENNYYDESLPAQGGRISGRRWRRAARPNRRRISHRTSF